MSSPSRGRGRGQSPRVTPQSPLRRPGSSELATDMARCSIGDKPERARGGFRQIELRTIPEGITNTKAPPNSAGVKCQVLSNFIKIEAMQNCTIHKYRIDFEPDVESQKLRQQLFKSATRELFANRVTYDGYSEAKSKHLVPKETQFHVDNPQEPGKLITIKLKNTGTVDWSSYELLRTYNMNMKDHLRKLGYYAVSKTGAYVHQDLSRQIDPEIMSVGGYRTAANVHQNGAILMNLETANKLMQRDNVLAYIKVLFNKFKGADFEQGIKAQLMGKLVVTSYKKVVYRIEDVDFGKNPTVSFFHKKWNRDTTYVEYFTNEHCLTDINLKQPLLVGVVNNKRRDAQRADEGVIHLLPQFCNIAGLTEEQGRDNELRNKLIRASQIAPKERVEDLKRFLTQLNGNDEIKKMLKEWGYSYGTSPLLVNARQVPTTNVGIGQENLQTPIKWSDVNHDGSFDRVVMYNRCAVPPQFNKLAIIVDKYNIQNEPVITKKLLSAMARIGVSPRSYEVVKIQEGDRAHQYVAKLRNLPQDTTAAIVIMTEKDTAKYNAIKKQASCEKGLITQVVTSDVMLNTTKSGGASVKIAIQIAAKLGGEPWYVNTPEADTMMVCGYDTYHDTTNRGRSFGAFTASQNPEFSKWYSKADCHERLDELSSHMAANLTIALNRYKQLNRRIYPKRVFIYRDGVGDGQLEHVFNVEVKQIKKAIEACDKSIKLTFIVVNKRIGARFYLRQGNSYDNPKPGTVIDDVVTRQERYDFYSV